jgi:large subunit ribosomal protein LP0
MTKLLDRKKKLGERLVNALREYNAFLIVCADNVGSNHIQKIRMSLRGKAEMIMGKNTVFRRVLRDVASELPVVEQILPHLRGNVGFIFAQDEVLMAVRRSVIDNKVGAPARAGAIAPCNVVVPAGPTGLEPTQTSFLQALNIDTMISKGQIEIKSDVHLMVVGDKVTASQAALLQKLDIRPFAYGLGVKLVYKDGLLFESSVLDRTDDDLLQQFGKAVQNVACVSLAISLPTVASLPHSLSNAFQNVLAVSVATAYTFDKSEQIKAYLENPDAFAVATPVAAATGDSTAAAAEEPAEESDEVGCRSCAVVLCCVHMLCVACA